MRMRRSTKNSRRCLEMDSLRSCSAPSIMNEFVWKKHVYSQVLSQRPEDSRHVMVIYCGGTVGMKFLNQGECSYMFNILSDKTCK